jgi:hypothetical protein
VCAVVECAFRATIYIAVIVGAIIVDAVIAAVE